MANINEAFNTNQPKSNTVYNKYTAVENAFDRVKISDIKYDKIVRSDRSVYGYTCNVCKGCMGYHMSIQHKLPHDFIKGEYRLLHFYEQGPFFDGNPLLN